MLVGKNDDGEYEFEIALKKNSHEEKKMKSNDSLEKKTFIKKFSELSHGMLLCWSITLSNNLACQILRKVFDDKHGELKEKEKTSRQADLMN